MSQTTNLLVLILPSQKLLTYRIQLHYELIQNFHTDIWLLSLKECVLTANYFMDYFKGHKASIEYLKSMATWIPRKRFLQPIWSYQYDVVIAQSCLCPSVSSEHISTVCTGMIRPRIQRVPNTSLRLLLQGLRFSTSCPLCI